MPSPLAATTCANHPDRHGFALCMSCSKVVCQECATTWNGVNHCRSCLERRRSAGASGKQARAWIACALFCGAALIVAMRSFTWSAGMLARLW